MKLSDSVLIESKSARDQGLSAIVDQGLQQRLLSKVKSVFFALWRGTGYLTTKQLADFYGVLENTIRQNYSRFKSEFDADGVEKVEGEALREVRDILSLSSFTPQVSLYPPRAVIRMGFILQGSDVAVQVRTSALNVLQGLTNLVSSEEVLNSLIVANPPYRALIGDSELKISSPLEPHYAAIGKKLKSTYSTGGIPGLTKEKLREKLAALSTYTQAWKLNTQKEIQFTLKTLRTKYPDLASELIPINVDGETKTALFLFQLEDLMIEPEHVEECLGRQYAKHAKGYCMPDYVYQFLVAPFGATPDAQAYIQNHLPQELKGFVGVVTVKELAEFLRDQAWQERMRGLVKGEINTQFEEILKYRIPDDPLSILMGLTFG